MTSTNGRHIIEAEFEKGGKNIMKRPNRKQARLIDAIKNRIALLIEVRRQCHGLQYTQAAINRELDENYNYLYLLYKEIYN